MGTLEWLITGAEDGPPEGYTLRKGPEDTPLTKGIRNEWSSAVALFCRPEGVGEGVTELSS